MGTKNQTPGRSLPPARARPLLAISGRSIYFRTNDRVAPGDELTLGIPRHRVLVFDDPDQAREGLVA